MHLSHLGNRGAAVLSGVIDTDYWGELELLIHNVGKEDCTRRTGDPTRQLLVSSCPTIKANRKLWQHNPNRMINVPEPSGMVTLPSTTVGPTDVLSEKKGNTEWIVEDVHETCQLGPHDKLKK